MNHLSTLESKIVSAEKAVEIIASWRKKPCKIVFTNGCFDLVHAGHVDYLAKAASLGDFLVVGLNTDSSVSRIKGPLRPVASEFSRMHVMAAFSFVSLVILFDEETPLELIKKVQPDVLVKGADYTIDKIVGADVVQSRGGTVTTIEFLEGYSTSGLINRIIGNTSSQL